MADNSSHSSAPHRKSVPFALGQRRSTIHFQAPKGRPRWVLHLQATFWRVLMGLGMLFHKLAPPRPPKPDFTREIPSTISGKPGNITLHFYVPKDWQTQRRLWEHRPEAAFRDDVDLLEGEDEEDARPPKSTARRVSTALSTISQSVKGKGRSARRWGGYPVIINFHGGGFTLGKATDDARWCGTVVDECNAVVISVDYRLAPEYPFPVAVEDGADAVLWVHENAEEIGVDREKIALSGFSSGGNMVFSVPLRLYDEMTGFAREEILTAQNSTKKQEEHAAYAEPAMVPDSASSSSTKVPPEARPDVVTINPDDPTPPDPNLTTKTDAKVDLRPIPDIHIRCIIPWYPSLDYTRTREDRRATSRRKDQDLPALFTDLFDESYLHPPDKVNLNSPYLSPGIAPTELLKYGLPEEVIMHTCEFDMLLDEGEAFRDRLTSDPLNKKVTYRMVEGVPHGWDKAPNPCMCCVIKRGGNCLC